MPKKKTAPEKSSWKPSTLGKEHYLPLQKEGSQATPSLRPRYNRDYFEQARKGK